MSGGRTYSEDEFALVLRKASELSRSPDLARQEEGLSLEEMKAIAAEAGIDPALIERAALTIPEVEPSSALTRVLGGPLRMRSEVYVPRSLDASAAAHLLDLVRASIERQGKGDATESGMSWHSVGEGSQIIVTAHAEGPGTRIKVRVDRTGPLVATGLFTFLGTLATGIAILAAGNAGLTAAIGVPLFGAGVAGVLAAARTAWGNMTRGLQEQMGALTGAVSRAFDRQDDGTHAG